jgi:CheY-like chemotaxis protein/tetratricopeptide (TPR) repeat protein
MPPYLLVIESDPELQQRIGDTLRQAQYELSAETDAAWAKRSLLVRPPDGVILDTQLSDGSGFQVAEELRKDPDTKTVPIFFVASRYRGASHQAETRRRFAPAEYLTTPLDLDSLLATVLEMVPPTDPGAVPAPVADYPSGPLTDAAQRRERKVVEAVARELSSIDPDLRGSLAYQPFARILQRVYADRLTGALLLLRDSVKKIVYFVEGYPASVRSNILGECLGQILLQQKMISKQTLDESLVRMKADKKHQGTVLVEMGALSPYNLTRALVAQMEAKFYEIFSWRTGDFAFKEGKGAPDEPVHLERAPAALILEGIRRHYDQERVRSVLAAFAGQYVAPSRDPLRRLQDITADAAERRFIESLDGSLRLEAALSTSPVPIQRARLLLVAMSEAGMIEPARSKRSNDERRRGNNGADTAVVPLEQKGREELAAAYESMRGQTHFEVLGVGADASAGEVDAAYEALAREYHPDQFRARSDDVRALGMRIFDRLGEAQVVLRDTGRRRKYQAQLERDRAALEEGDSAPFVQRESTGDAAEQVYFAGVEHLRARRYREAVQAFRQAAALAPGQASYRGALGWALFRRAPADIDAIQAGLTELRRAVQMEPSNPWVRISLGRFFAETGYPDDAIAEFEVALRLNPGLADIEEEIRRLRGQT